jgi:type I site-specific restriction-modification system R (restriction) subunit
MPQIYVDFSLLTAHLSLRTTSNGRQIHCVIRKRYFVVTPEELVRQLLLHYLIKVKNYPKNSIAVEKQIILNGQKKRFDILVFTPNAEPFLLIECKASDVPIIQSTFDQIARYNMVLKANFMVVCNGRQTYCYTQTENGYCFLAEFPDYGV